MRALWLTIYLPSFLTAAGQQALVVLLPLYALAIDGGAGLAPALTAARGAGSMAINIPAGMLVARFGDKAVMVASLLGMALAALLIATSTNALLIGGLALIYGAGSGAWLLARLSFISEVAPLAYRGRAMAGLGGVQRVGMLLGPAAGGLLATTTGYGVTFALIGLCSLGSLLLMLLFGSSAHGRRPPEPGRIGLRVLCQVIREHAFTFATAGMSTVALMVLRSSRVLLIPIWGASVGLNEAAIGLTFLISSLIEIAMAYPAGYLIDHQGHKFTALPCFALLALSIALLPLAHSFTGLVLVGLLAGLGNGFGAGIIMTLGSDYAPPDRRGEFLGVWRMLGDGGLVLGPVLVGAVAAATSMAVACLAVAGVGFAGMALMAGVVREPSPRR